MKSAVPEEDLAKLKISRDGAASGPVAARNKIRRALLIALRLKPSAAQPLFASWQFLTSKKGRGQMVFHLKLVYFVRRAFIKSQPHSRKTCVYDTPCEPPSNGAKAGLPRLCPLLRR